MAKLFSFKTFEMNEKTKGMTNLLNQRNEFIKEMIKVMEEEDLEEDLKELITNKMVCFGPTAAAGTNILIAQGVKAGQSFL